MQPKHEVEPDALRLDDYASLVTLTRNHDLEDGWAGLHSDFIVDEQREVLSQHGPGLLVLLSSTETLRAFPDIDFEELKRGMADELGDMLWFGFSAAEYFGKQPGELITRAIAGHIGTAVQTPQTFTELEEIVARHAGDIRYRNKYGLMSANAGDAGYATLEQNPGYIFMRATSRLERSLKADDYRGAAPPSATDLEARAEVDIALGDYLCMLAYVAPVKLGWPLESVACHNIQKLMERDRWGKPELGVAQG